MHLIFLYRRSSVICMSSFIRFSICATYCTLSRLRTCLSPVRFILDYLIRFSNRNSRLISFVNQAAVYVVYSVVKTRRRMQSGGINSYRYYP